MPRGRHTSLTISLTATERQTLTAWQRSTTIPAGRAKRGRIILLLADRMPLSHISRMVGISRRFVYKWAKRFLQDGLEALNYETPRRPLVSNNQKQLMLMSFCIPHIVTR